MTTLSLLLITASSFHGMPKGELLDFSAEWCGPCQQMSPIVSRLKRQGYPIRKIDVDKHPNLANKYGVESIPTFVLVVDGKVLNRIVGMTSEGQLKRMLAQIPDEISRARATTRTHDPKTDSAPAPFSPLDTAEVREPPPKKRIRFPFFGQKRDTAEEETATAPPMPPVVRAKLGEGRKKGDALSGGSRSRAHVRIRVKDDDGVNFGSGTIVESRHGQTTILTCGHMFEKLKKETTVEVDVFSGTRFETYVGRLLSYDLEADIGLVTIPTEDLLAQLPIKSSSKGVMKNARVFSVGCSNGESPTQVESTITALNRYRGPDNIECSGFPEQGRSGGGLFDKNGELIGVCIAADPRDRRGLYAGLKPIYQLLEGAKLSRLIRKPDALAGGGRLPRSRTPRVNAFDEQRRPLSGQPSRLEAGIRPASFNRSADAVEPASRSHVESHTAVVGDVAIPEGLGDAEVVCIIRPLNAPQAASRVVIINRASPKFVNYLTNELRDQPRPTMGTVKFRKQASPRNIVPATAVTTSMRHRRYRRLPSSRQ